MWYLLRMTFFFLTKIHTTHERKEDGRNHPAQSRRHNPYFIRRSDSEGQVRASRHAHGQRRFRHGPLGEVPPPQSGRPDLDRTRPLRALRRPRLHADLFAPPPLQLRPLHGRAEELPPVGQPDSGPSGIRPYQGRRYHDRPAGQRFRLRGRHGDRRQASAATAA